MNRVRFLDLARGVDALRAEIGVAIDGVLGSGRFILGERVEEFEQAFAKYCSVAHAVGIGSGTDALRLALLACDIERGDEVVTVSNTCVPTVSAICAVGARPVFVDVDPATYTIDPTWLEAWVTPRTRAILLVHLYGQCADIDPILHVATHGLRVIEDCAQAHGARYRGRAAGTMGDVGCYSFYPTKTLGALGDAGIVVTDDPEIADRVRLLAPSGYQYRPGA